MREIKFREWETYRKTMAVGIREDVIVKAIDGVIYPPAIKTAGLPEI